MGNEIGRRDFFRAGIVQTIGLSCLGCSKTPVGRFFSRHLKGSGKNMNPNILLITADDMNYDSPGATGNRTPGITPNLDRLASEGMRFVHSHVTIAVCQPSRSVLMTGRFPHRNGAMGFESIWEHVPTLQEQLSNAGYFNGIMAKVGHLHPEWKFCWDFVVKAKL